MSIIICSLRSRWRTSRTSSVNTWDATYSLRAATNVVFLVSSRYNFQRIDRRIIFTHGSSSSSPHAVVLLASSALVLVVIIGQSLHHQLYPYFTSHFWVSYATLLLLLEISSYIYHTSTHHACALVAHGSPTHCRNTTPIQLSLLLY